MKKARVAIQDASRAVPSSQAGIPRYLWVWGKGRGEGQEPRRLKARARSWLPRAGVCGKPGAG